ncbi:nitrile hydratase subunit alpha [Rhizobium sp. X9]|uniref:nitrile hydratase subunit alpha n=2 Tax=unclassified Rhizobium TaxID=2613769 RepID=UPI001C0E5679|nr:nitrile hydratase subunit alpha [Rhizobium sp. X9]
MANGDAQYFKATLYFDNEPAISGLTLTEAWGEEGYECEPLSEKGVFDGLRGSTRVFVGAPEPVMAPVPPAQYPAVAQTNIDWSKTFCVDAKAACDDFRHATHQCEFRFLIMADENDPEIAHNEIVSTLLGIHQVAPMRAVALHYLDMIVGRTNLDDYLNYANSHLDQPQQMAEMLAFGAFVTEEAGAIRSWTTGLEHFGQTNLILDTSKVEATEVLLTIFGLGHLVVNGRRFAAGEAITSYDLLARFEAAELDGRPMLRIVRHEAGENTPS